MVTDRIALGHSNWDNAINTIKAQVPVNIGNISADRLQADVTGDNQGVIVAYEAVLTSQGFIPTNLGNVPQPPPPTPTPPPTADEITRDAEVVTAFNTIMDAKITAWIAEVEVEYNNIATTAEPFLLKSDIKHLRQRLN